MFVVHCPECDQQMLLGVRSIRQLHNLDSGAVAVEMTCYRGHSLMLMSGNAHVTGSS